MSWSVNGVLTSVVFIVSLTNVDSSFCSGGNIDIYINDTVMKGSVIHNLTGTGTASLVCSELYIDNDTNSVILNVTLRNPCYPSSTLQCELTCGGMETANVFLSITRTDQFPPVFEQRLYKTSVKENAEIGREVFRLSNSTNVTDQDCGAQNFNYKLEQEDKHFYIGGNSLGDIRLNTTLNFEKQSSYMLNVSVSNSNQEDRKGYTILEINIDDVDDRNPSFTSNEYRLNISEENVASEWLVTDPPVLGLDGDTGINQTILYSFEDTTNSSEHFKIDKATGRLLQIKSINRENRSSLSLVIKCYQNDKPETRTATSSIMVTVLDINDHLPIFQPTTYNVSLVENAIGYVTTVLATDLDQGANAEFTYHLSSDSNGFQVDAITGVITVKDSAALDRELNETFQLEVFAVDNNGNVSANNATVQVTLIDVNDNSPQFSVDQYDFFFNQTQLGYVVGQINASDADKPRSNYSDIRFSFLSTWSSPNVAVFPLTIDDRNGEINITGLVTPATRYNMVVQACDSPRDETNRRCSSCPVLAIYTPNSTTVLNENMTMYVKENSPVGTLVQVLSVIGDDYRISTDIFEVDKASHVLKTGTVLDRENISSYSFTVSVISSTSGVILNKWPQKARRLVFQPVGNLSINLNVLDVNDNVPTFDQQEYFFSLPDSKGVVTSVLGSLQSEDLDESENSNRTYSFYGISYPDIFYIDPVSGSISLLDSYWTSLQTMYPLVAMVSDHGTPSLSSIVTVYISHMKMESSLVRISAPISKVQIETSKSDFETGVANLLGYNSVTFEQINDVAKDITSIRSYISLSAFYSNKTVVSGNELQSSVARHWTAVQDIFRQVSSASQSIEDESLETAEIALIAVSVVVFFGAFIAIFVVCRQWNIHIKQHQLYQHMSRRSTIYDSQEMKVNFGEETVTTSRPSTFRGSTHRRSSPEPIETSFGGNYINPVFTDDDGNPVLRSSSWTDAGTPRIPRWSTSDSLKDAIASLEDLTSRLNSEDNISRVSNMSKSRQSQKSFKPDSEFDDGTVPMPDYPVYDQVADHAALVHSDVLDRVNSHHSDMDYRGKPIFADGEILREIIEVNAPNSEENNNVVTVTEVSTAF